jgi:predicted DNA-binding transcriptional regulator AlpA
MDSITPRERERRERQRFLSETQLLTVNEAADFLRLKASTLAKMRCDGDGPKYLRRGRVLYPLAELEAWIAGRLVASTAEAETAA